ncbi:hypothetical protein GSI_01981 [Ganoderma sinense ZZ0214-1]|uniref:Uncharacterized protein n=1 Tax=Ganoderma sinense ZZ0214-1 TaxID=1077348 RepID=A0A2G8SNB2_9APHY|nr:hypothetical protein GSI_01981 [Ganoderma sinense ZZ0214-1]
MFSHELFDFASTGHLSDAHVDAPDPYHDALFDSYIDSSCVDQSFVSTTRDPHDPLHPTRALHLITSASQCSDFACCGQALPDLHRLLEHFEEEHVLPLPSDARPLFSSPVYAQPRSGPCTSYILSYPQPDPPLHTPAVPHSIPASPTPRGVLPSLQFSEIPPVAVPDLTHTPLSPSPSASSATSAHSSPEPGEPLCLPPALFSFQPTPSSSPSRGHRDRPRGHATSDTDVDMDESDEEASADGGFEDTPPRTRSAPTSSSHSSLPAPVLGNTAGPHRRVKNKTSAARMEPFGTARRSPSERERAPSSPKRRDGREKAFKCPVSARAGSVLFSRRWVRSYGGEERTRVRCTPEIRDSVIESQMAELSWCCPHTSPPGRGVCRVRFPGSPRSPLLALALRIFPIQICGMWVSESTGVTRHRGQGGE